MSNPWAEAKKGEAWKATLESLQDIEQRQGKLYQKYRKLGYLYDPRRPGAIQPTRKREAIPSFNVIATSVDSVHSSLASQPVRARIITDGAEWAEQRKAKQLQKYSDALAKRFFVQKQAKRAVFASALKGLGLVKVTAGCNPEIAIEPVQPDDIFVDDEETANCQTRRMQHRYLVDVDELAAKYPDCDSQIRAAKGKAYSVAKTWNKPRQPPNQVVVIESWCLPAGKKDKPGYKVGRHTVCIDGKDLLDDGYEKAHFPFALFRWSEGDGSSFFGIGGGERIVVHQAKLAKLDFCSDRQIENNARPVTYTTVAALAMMGRRTIHQTGQYVPTPDGSEPKTVTPSSVSGEQLSYRERTKMEAFEEFGTSRQLINGGTPAGLESGVAVREARQNATGRFALQESDFEQLVLDIMWLVLDTCKDLGENAPSVKLTTFKGASKTLKWGDVDMVLVREQMEASSTIANTVAGRQALAGEMVQAGMISLEESRRLIDNPDVGKSLSVVTAAIESTERQIEEILDGEILMPTTDHPLKMVVWRFTQAILAAENDGAPEDAIERLRNFKLFASGILDEQEARKAAAMQPPPMPEQAAPSPMDPAAPIPEEMLPMSAP